MTDYNRLQQDKELMADFEACMKYRRAHMHDVYQFALARKYDIGFISRMQNLGYHSLWICIPLLYFFPYRETTLWCLLQFSLAVHWDNWWGEAFSGHQHFDYFSRKELQDRYGDRWEDDSELAKYRSDSDDD